MTRGEQTEATDLQPEIREQEILTQLQAGERGNLGLLIDHYGADLMSYLVAVVGKRDMAEDVFQDTWVRVMERIRRFDATRSFRPWLFRVARNLAYDRMRLLRWRSRLRIGAPDREDDMIDVAAPGDFREGMMAEQMVKVLLAGLDPALREVIWLRYYGEMSYEQIADQCRLPLGTVKSRLARALDQFAHRYRHLKGTAHG